jgi:LmbE family N-acetylglucosaminyl deacetylase
VTNLFVSPHPDDVALSCGALVASLLRERGEQAMLVTVYSGPGSSPSLTPYQREALGFGQRPPGLTPKAAMAERRAEDQAYAAESGADLVFLDLPDAVFRGYDSEAALMGPPRMDDLPPVDEIRRQIARAKAEKIYFPLGVGGHVDHRLARMAGIILATELGERLTFYEDFPYIAWRQFERLEQLEEGALAGLPPHLRLEPYYFEMCEYFDVKVRDLRAYASQLPVLFPGSNVEIRVEQNATRVGRLGGVGPAERYWQVVSS